MFFSIILPIYNVEEYLSRCIESIQMQACKDFEIIIVDDESTDNSLQIAKEAKEKYGNIVILEQSHAGQAAGRNKALKIARGEYITFIDGDDYWEDGHLEQLKQLLCKTKPDLCVGLSFFIIQDGKKTTQTLVKCENEVEYGSVDILFREEKIPGSMCMLTCKRSIIQENRIAFSEELLCNEDFDFFMKVVVSSKNAMIFSKPYYNYYRDNFSSTYAMMSGEKIHSYMIVYRYWFDYFTRYDSYCSYGETIRSAISQNYAWAYYQLIDLPLKDNFFKTDILYIKETQYILKNMIADKHIVRSIYMEKIKREIHRLGHNVKEAIKR